MLNLIGTGLTDEKDLTLKALETLRNSDKIYLETYTSPYQGDIENLKKLTGKDIQPLGRTEIEENPHETLLKEGQTISLLIVGDPLTATTHTDLLLRAREKGIKTQIIHNASIYTAVAESGLQLYKFGRTTTIPYPEGTYFPKSPYDIIKDNKMRNLHTLCLLDIQAEKNKYMSVNEALELLLKMEYEKMQNQIRPETPAVGAARIGSQNQTIKYGEIQKLIREDFGKPPHTLIIPGKLHEMEEEILKQHKI
jgi:diphthine synthase